MAIISVKNLRLRTIIGIFDYEREHKQDIVINMKILFDDSKAAATDNINDTVDYKKMTKKIIAEVEKSEFFLLEKLADFILKIIMEEEKIKTAKIKVDKPHALRYADSVSIVKIAKRKHEQRHN
jgi:D-erythro-7,8-dihydroneopterin triphosphate epimerase